MFVKHIDANIKKMPEICAIELKHATLIFPDKNAYNMLELLLLSLIICLLAIYAAYQQGNNFKMKIKRNFLSKKILWLFILIFIVPVLISTTIIYPREHYLMISIVLITIFILTFIFFPEIKYYGLYTIYLLILGAILFFASPPMKTFKNYSNYKPNLTVINYLRSLNISMNINLLESEGGYNIYAKSNYHRIAEYQKYSGFNDFREKNNINMILVGGRLLHDKRFSNDIQWTNFLNNYKEFGFIKKSIPNSGFDIILADYLK